MLIFKPHSVLTLPQMDGAEILRLNAIDEDLLRQARSFWDRVRGSRSMPSLSDIDPVEMHRSILPHVFLVNVLEHPRKYVFRLAGTKVEEHVGPIKGKSPDSLNFGAEATNILRQYDKTVSHRTPTEFRHNFIGTDRRRYDFTRLLMPLSPNDKDVRWLFGIVLFFGRHHSPLNPMVARAALMGSLLLSLP
jgi:hypothetical protein